MSVNLKARYQDDTAYTSLNSLQNLRHLARHCQHTIKSNENTPLIGNHKTRALGRGMEFEEVRQYQAGDDVRTIDWRVTARTQTPHVKRYTEEKEKPIITAVDQRQSLFFGSHPCFKSVYACHIAALLNWATLNRGDRCGGVVISNDSILETRAARNHKTVNRWLQQLSNTNQQLNSQTQAKQTIKKLLEHLLHLSQTGTHIYLISDFYDLNSECEHLLFQLSRHQKVTLIWIYDQLEISLPPKQQLSISDGHKTTSIFVNKNITTAFKNEFLHKESYLKELSAKLQLPLVKAPVQTPAIDITRAILR